MRVGELKKALENIPDNYEIRSRARNFNLRDNEEKGNFNFYDTIEKIKVFDRTVVLIRDFE